MWQDPVVQEVRAIRLRIEEECDGDFDKIFVRAVEEQRAFANRLMSKPTQAPQENSSNPERETA